MKSLNQKLKRVKPLLGTFVEIELRAKADIGLLSQWITAGFEAIEEIDRLMSVYRAGSDLSRLNQAEPGVWVEVHPHTAKVLRASNELWLESDGIFDVRCPHPTFGHLLPRYRGRRQDIGLPSPGVSRERVPKGRVRAHFEVRGACARKSGPWKFDLGGIAKGYAVDCAVRTIQKSADEIKTGGVVNAGGDLRAWGDTSVPAAAIIHGRNSSWARPFKIQRTAAASSAVRQKGRLTPILSPARYFRMPKGRLFRKARSITVLASRCLWADALTKIALLGPEEIATECLSHYGAKALVFSSDGGLSEVLG